MWMWEKQILTRNQILHWLSSRPEQNGHFHPAMEGSHCKGRRSTEKEEEKEEGQTGTTGTENSERGCTGVNHSLVKMIVVRPSTSTTAYSKMSFTSFWVPGIGDSRKSASWQKYLWFSFLKQILSMQVPLWRKTAISSCIEFMDKKFHAHLW